MDLSSVLLLLVVVGLVQSQCQAEEVFADLDYDLLHDPAKTLRELKSATPRKAAQLLASSHADEKDFIGKYSKWDYLNLIDLEPKYCLREETEKRELLCRSTDLAGLRLYCDFCVAHLKDYCQRIATSRILNIFIESKDKSSVVEQALEVSQQVDEFIKQKGDENAADETNLLEFCKSLEWTERKPKVYTCSAFNKLISDLAQYEQDQEDLFQYLRKRTNSSVGFEQVASRCKTMVRSCHNPISSLIKH